MKLSYEVLLFNGLAKNMDLFKPAVSSNRMSGPKCMKNCAN